MASFRFEEIEALERRVAAPDRAAFTDLRRAYRHLLEHFLFIRLNDQREAERLAGEIFDRAWASIRAYRWQDFSFEVWLLRIAREVLPESEPGESRRGLRRGL